MHQRPMKHMGLELKRTGKISKKISFFLHMVNSFADGYNFMILDLVLD